MLKTFVFLPLTNEKTVLSLQCIKKVIQINNQLFTNIKILIIMKKSEKTTTEKNEKNNLPTLKEAKQITELATAKGEKVTPEEVKKAFKNARALFKLGEEKILKENPKNAHPDQYIYIAGVNYRSCNAIFYPNGAKPETKNHRAPATPKKTFTEQISDLFNIIIAEGEKIGVKYNKKDSIKVYAGKVDNKIKEQRDNEIKAQAKQRASIVEKRTAKMTDEELRKEIERRAAMRKAAANA